MRPVFLFALITVMVCVAASTVAFAGGPDPARYPLRVHIMKFNKRQVRDEEGKKSSDAPEYVQGMGVADLFENGEPQGFQFSYECIDGVQESGGYGTFPARWKRKDKTLEILLPEPRKPQNLETCALQVEMRPGLVFYWKNGALAEESAAALKAWMGKHQYDPENNKEFPILAAGETAGPDGEVAEDPQLAGP
jgi:hypothetical protein